MYCLLQNHARHTLNAISHCSVKFVFDMQISLRLKIQSLFLLYPMQRVAEGMMFLNHPSVSQSVGQSCFSCQFFSRSYALCELRNLDKIKDTTETVCQRNSSETAKQNFVEHCCCHVDV